MTFRVLKWQQSQRDRQEIIVPRDCTPDTQPNTRIYKEGLTERAIIQCLFTMWFLDFVTVFD